MASSDVGNPRLPRTLPKLLSFEVMAGLSAIEREFGRHHTVISYALIEPTQQGGLF